MHKDQKNYLDLLTVVTPDAGWKVEEAFLATYSLDLQALGMMLMAMAFPGLIMMETKYTILTWTK